MSKLNEIFSVSYGNKLDYNKMTPLKNGIAFISRSSKNNGIVDFVEKFQNIEPFMSGSVTVTLGGTYLLSAFIQKQPFYTAQNIAVLTPIVELSEAEILFYCTCLGINRRRYSAFGREANVTLGEIELPDVTDIPSFVRSFSMKKYGLELIKKSAFTCTDAEYPISNSTVPLSTLFTPANGVASSELIKNKNKTNDSWAPFIRPSYRQETSCVEYVKKKHVLTNKLFPSGTLYVSTNGQGSHTYSYVSATEFVPNSDVTVLLPNRDMGLQEKLFYAHCITNNRYKFSYGRKPKGVKLGNIMLPEFPPQYVIKLDMNHVINSFSDILEKLV